MPTKMTVHIDELGVPRLVHRYALDRSMQPTGEYDGVAIPPILAGWLGIESDGYLYFEKGEIEKPWLK